MNLIDKKKEKRYKTLNECMDAIEKEEKSNIQQPRKVIFHVFELFPYPNDFYIMDLPQALELEN